MRCELEMGGGERRGKGEEGHQLGYSIVSMVEWVGFVVGSYGVSPVLPFHTQSAWKEK